MGGWDVWTGWLGWEGGVDEWIGEMGWLCECEQTNVWEDIGMVDEMNTDGWDECWGCTDRCLYVWVPGWIKWVEWLGRMDRCIELWVWYFLLTGFTLSLDNVMATHGCNITNSQILIFSQITSRFQYIVFSLAISPICPWAPQIQHLQHWTHNMYMNFLFLQHSPVRNCHLPQSHSQYTWGDSGLPAIYIPLIQSPATSFCSASLKVCWVWTQR